MISENEIKILIEAATESGNFKRVDELELMLEHGRKQRFQNFHQMLHDTDTADLY